MKRLTLAGEGGQGCRVIALSLAKLLLAQGYEATVVFDYDSAVRGGMSCAYLTWDTVPIENPIIDEADFLLRLSNKPRHMNAKEEVCERGIGGEIEIPFSQLGMDNFGKEMFGNMIATGFLIKELGIRCTEEDLESLLPRRYRDENLQALRMGLAIEKEDYRVRRPAGARVAS